MQTPNLPAVCLKRLAWNKGRIVGQKRPLLTKHVWAISVRLEIAEISATWLCSIWPWTASYGDVTLSG